MPKQTTKQRIAAIRRRAEELSELAAGLPPSPRSVVVAPPTKKGTMKQRIAQLNKVAREMDAMKATHAKKGGKRSRTHRRRKSKRGRKTRRIRRRR